MSRRATFAYVITGIALCACIYFIARSVLYAPQDDEGVPATVMPSVIYKPTIVPPSSPGSHMDLSIPSVGINASVQEVGVTKKGNVGTPSNFTDAAWYNGSPLPGSNGTAIIDGHVDNGLALPAVFWKLKDVKKGDDVYVQMKDGSTVHFIVTGITTYDFNTPTGAIFANSSGPTLKLITCAGVWVPQYRTHDKRLVVTAEKVE